MEIKHTNGHYEVFYNGDFIFSADTYREALSEIEIYIQQHKINVL